MTGDTINAVRRMRKSFGAKNAELHRDFSIFISKVLLPRKTGRADFPEAHSLLEVERMLVEGQHQWVDNLLKQGEERGIDRNKRETALRMLEWGDSDEKIVACARITAEELAELKKEALQKVH